MDADSMHVSDRGEGRDRGVGHFVLLFLERGRGRGRGVCVYIVCMYCVLCMYSMYGGWEAGLPSRRLRTASCGLLLFAVHIRYRTVLHCKFVEDRARRGEGR